MSITTTTRTTAAACAALGLLAAASTGCTDNANHRLTIGDSIALASFPPEVVEIQLDESGNPLPPEQPADDQATALGLDRSNFEPIVYHVPVDGTRHEFHGFDRLALTSETARQRGEFPTSTSALETGTNASTRRQIVEMLAQPAYAATGIVTNLIISTSGGRTSPSDLHERAPSPGDPMKQGVIHDPATPVDIPSGAQESSTD